MPAEGRSARDYTEIWAHRNKQWSVNDLSLVNIPGGGGLDFQSSGFGAGAAAVGILVFLPPFWLVGLPLYCLVPVAVIFFTIGYWLATSGSDGREGPRQKLANFATGKFKQPGEIIGGRADRHPHILHWRVIVWRPDWAVVHTAEPMRRYVTYDPKVVESDEFRIEPASLPGFEDFFADLANRIDTP
jgi:hypothetical protein